MIVNLLLCWLLWIMIYYAQRTYPIIMRSEEEYVAEMRDRIVCDDIISRDDILSTEDSPLFLRILQILDFLYFTVFPAFVTCAGLYILKSLLLWAYS